MYEHPEIAHADHPVDHAFVHTVPVDAHGVPLDHGLSHVEPVVLAHNGEDEQQSNGIFFDDIQDYDN